MISRGLSRPSTTPLFRQMSTAAASTGAAGAASVQMSAQGEDTAVKRWPRADDGPERASGVIKSDPIFVRPNRRFKQKVPIVLSTNGKHLKSTRLAQDALLRSAADIDSPLPSEATSIPDHYDLETFGAGGPRAIPPPPPTTKVKERRAVVYGDDGMGRSVYTVVSALCDAAVRHGKTGNRQLFQEAIRKAAACARTPLELSRVIHILSHHPPFGPNHALLHHLVTRATEQFEELPLRSVCLIGNTLIRFDHPHASFLAKLAPSLPSLLTRANSTDLPHLVSIAVRFQEDVLIDDPPRKTHRKDVVVVEDGGGEEEGSGVRMVEKREFWKQVARELSRVVAELRPEGYASLLQSILRSQEGRRHLIVPIVRKLTRAGAPRLPTFSSSQLVNVALCLQQLDYLTPAFMHLVHSASLIHTPTAPPRDLVSLYALYVKGPTPPNFLLASDPHWNVTQRPPPEFSKYRRPRPMKSPPLWVELGKKVGVAGVPDAMTMEPRTRGGGGEVTGTVEGEEGPVGMFPNSELDMSFDVALARPEWVKASLTDLSERLREMLPKCSPTDLAELLHAHVMRGDRDSRLSHSVVVHLMARLGELSPNSLAMVANDLTKLNRAMAKDEWIGKICEALDAAKIGQLTPVGVHSLLTAFQRAGCAPQSVHKPLFLLSQRLAASLPSSPPFVIAGCLSALAHLRFTSPDLINALVARATSQAHQFADIETLLRMVAGLRMAVESCAEPMDVSPFIDAIAPVAVKRLGMDEGAWGPNEVADFVCHVAALCGGEGRGWGIVCEGAKGHLMKWVRPYGAREVLRMMEGMQRGRVEDKDVWQTLWDQARINLDVFPPRDLLLVASTLARLRPVFGQQRRRFGRISNALIAILQAKSIDDDTKVIAQLVHVWGSMDLRDNQLLLALTEALQPLPASFDLADLSRVAFGLTKLGFPHSDLFGQLNDKTASLLTRVFSHRLPLIPLGASSDLSDMLRLLSALILWNDTSPHTRSAFIQLLDGIAAHHRRVRADGSSLPLLKLAACSMTHCHRIEASDVSPSTLPLYHFLTSLLEPQAEPPPPPAPAPALPPTADLTEVDTADELSEGGCEGGRGERALNALERDVWKHLEMLANHRIAKTMYLVPSLLVDAAPFVVHIADTHYKVVIEVGLPNDFYTEMDGTQIEWTAWSRARHRLLRAMGWHVALVPYFDWEPLRSEHEKMHFLRRQIGRAMAESEGGGAREADGRELLPVTADHGRDSVFALVSQ